MANDVQAPEVLMSVRHIFLQLDQNAEEIVRPVQAPVDDWNFALDALAAMDDARHEWVIGPWQCGYDDGIYEGMYDFKSFICQCPECEAEYRKGFEEGMKAEE